MSVMGLPFIFNGIPSEFYNCSIVFIDENPNKRTSGDGRTFTTIKPLRSSRQSILNVQVDQSLTFGIEIVFDNPVDIHTLTSVKNWLSSPLKFCKLQICSDLFEQYYWNCYITLNEDLIYAGGYRGVTATVTCDAPWAWSTPKNLYLKDGLNKFLNNSEDCSFVRPKLYFTTQAVDSYIIIEIYNDELTYDETFIMDGLPNNTRKYTQANGTEVEYHVPEYAKRFNIDETVVFDSDTGMFTSFDSSNNIIKNAYRSQNFNKTFILIPQGYININVQFGLVSNIKLNYQLAKRIGGGFY